MSDKFELYPVDADYELEERIAILAVDNDIEPPLHPVHLRNRAKKQLRELKAEGYFWGRSW